VDSCRYALYRCGYDYPCDHRYDHYANQNGQRGWVYPHDSCPHEELHSQRLYVDLIRVISVISMWRIILMRLITVPTFIIVKWHII
jgi:hypothetical protein